MLVLVEVVHFMRLQRVLACQQKKQSQAVEGHGQPENVEESCREDVDYNDRGEASSESTDQTSHVLMELVMLPDYPQIHSLGGDRTHDYHYRQKHESYEELCQT